jgi:hypothetical protein
MKTLPLLVAAVLISAPAAAEARGCGSLCGHTKEFYTCTPDNLAEELHYDYYATTVIDVMVDAYFGKFSAIHHTNDGRIINRADQYKFTAVRQISYGVTVWEGLSRKTHEPMRGVFTMSGSVETNNLRYTYEEYRPETNGSGERIMQSTCVMFNKDDGDPHDE